MQLSEESFKKPKTNTIYIFRTLQVTVKTALINGNPPNEIYCNENSQLDLLINVASLFETKRTSNILRYKAIYRPYFS